MPMGIATGPVHCKRCPKRTFANVSELRKHQWRSHPELYVNLSKTTSEAEDAEHERNRARTAKARAVQAEMRATRTDITVRQYIDTPEAAGINGDMKVSELVTRLKSQSKFLHEVIALIGSIQSQQQVEGMSS